MSKIFEEFKNNFYATTSTVEAQNNCILDLNSRLEALEQPQTAGKEDGATLIANERKRQVSKEGWTPANDATHVHGEMAVAAACYATHHTDATLQNPNTCHANGWPWGIEWWKPKTDVENLVRAGALIAAEIDRIQARQPSPSNEPIKEDACPNCNGEGNVSVGAGYTIPCKDCRSQPTKEVSEPASGLSALYKKYELLAIYNSALEKQIANLKQQLEQKDEKYRTCSEIASNIHGNMKYWKKKYEESETELAELKGKGEVQWPTVQEFREKSSELTLRNDSTRSEDFSDLLQWLKSRQIK